MTTLCRETVKETLRAEVERSASSSSTDRLASAHGVPRALEADGTRERPIGAPAPPAPRPTTVITAGLGQDVEVKMSKSILEGIQVACERAEHSVSTGLMQMVAQARKLDAERTVLVQQIEFLSRFTGKKPNTMSKPEGDIALSLTNP